MRYLIFIFTIFTFSSLNGQVIIPSQVDGINLKGKGTIQSLFHLDTLTGNFGLWQRVGDDIVKKSIGTGGLGVNVSSAFSSLDIQAETGSSEIAWFRRNSGGRQFRFQSSSSSALLDMYNASDVITMRLSAAGTSWSVSPFYFGGVGTATESVEVNGNIAVSNAYKLGLTGATPIGSLLNNSGRMAVEGSTTRSVAIRSGTFGDISVFDGTTGEITFSNYGVGNYTGGAISQIAVFDANGDVEEWPLSDVRNHTISSLTNTGVDLTLNGTTLEGDLNISGLTSDPSPVTSTTNVAIQTGAFSPKRITMDEFFDRRVPNVGFMSFGGASEVITLTGAGTSDWITNGTNTLFSNTLSSGLVTVQGDSIIIGKTGLTTIDVSLSFSGGNSSHYTIFLEINGSDITVSPFDRDMTGTGIGTGSLHYMYNATINDVVKLVVEETAGSTDMTVVGGSILVEIKN